MTDREKTDGKNTPESESSVEKTEGNPAVGTEGFDSQWRDAAQEAAEAFASL